MIRALAERDPGRYVLVHPWTRWRGRGALRRLPPGLPVRAYASGRRLEESCGLVHALDTRIPRGYRGPLIATIFDLLSLSSLSGELGLASPEFREAKTRRYRAIARRADAIVTLSAVVRDEILERLKPRARVEVIPPGVESPGAPSRERALELMAARGLEPPFILTVGALCPRKNLARCVETFLEARSACPGLKLLLAGEPAFGWEGSEDEKAALGHPGDVVLGGYLSPEELAAAYSLASALLHLSHYEGFGLTVLEAMAAGLPVVASDRGAIPEVAGGTAWLVDPTEPGAAASALRRVLAGGGDVERRREEGRTRAAGFTWSRAAGRIEQLYHEVGAGEGTLDGNGAPARPGPSSGV